jgi:hypothetical protein
MQGRLDSIWEKAGEPWAVDEAPASGGGCVGGRDSGGGDSGVTVVVVVKVVVAVSVVVRVVVVAVSVVVIVVVKAEKAATHHISMSASCTTNAPCLMRYTVQSDASLARGLRWSW